MHVPTAPRGHGRRVRRPGRRPTARARRSKPSSRDPSRFVSGRDRLKTPFRTRFVPISPGSGVWDPHGTEEKPRMDPRSRTPFPFEPGFPSDGNEGLKGDPRSKPPL